MRIERNFFVRQLFGDGFKVEDLRAILEGQSIRDAAGGPSGEGGILFVGEERRKSAAMEGKAWRLRWGAGAISDRERIGDFVVVRGLFSVADGLPFFRIAERAFGIHACASERSIRVGRGIFRYGIEGFILCGKRQEGRLFAAEALFFSFPGFLFGLDQVFLHGHGEDSGAVFIHADSELPWHCEFLGLDARQAPRGSIGRGPFRESSRRRLRHRAFRAHNRRGWRHRAGRRMQMVPDEAAGDGQHAYGCADNGYPVVVFLHLEIQVRQCPLGGTGSFKFPR